MIKIKRKPVIICLILVLLFAVIPVFFNMYNVATASAETEDSELVENYLNSDYLKNSSTYTIRDYSANLIGTKAAVKMEGGSYIVTNTNYDDPIVEIVPKQYFYTAGDFLKIGEEYGFYINTVKDSNEYYSTVMVFDITLQTEVPEHVDTAIITVEPLFEYRYVCLYGNGTVKMNNNYINYSTKSYCVIPCANIYGSKISYQQVDDFYLKDISFGTSLYNEQALNRGDPGYNAQNDYGSFFTGFDYAYSGKVREYGEFSYSDNIDKIASSAFDVALGIIGVVPGIGDAIELGASVLGLIFSIQDYEDTIISVKNDFDSHINGELVQNEKKITATSLYKNREDQLANYKDSDGNPQLYRTATVVCNTATEQSIWYGIGDYASGYYYIGHGAQKGMTPYFTRIVSNIALKVVSSKNDNIVAVNSGLTSDTLHSPVKKDLSIDDSNEIYMLANGEDHFLVEDVRYESEYVININLSDDAKVKVNGQTKIGDNLAFNLNVKQGEDICIDFTDNLVGLTGNISITPTTNTTKISISEKSYYIIKTELINVKSIRCSNNSVSIADICTLKNGELKSYTKFGDFDAAASISYPFEEGIYYILLYNESSSQLLIDLDISDVATLSIGENKELHLSELNLNYFKFIPNEEVEYVVSLINEIGDEYSFVVLDNKLQEIEGNYYSPDTHGYMLLPNKNYYVGIKTNKKELASTIYIEETNNSFSWQIYGGEYGDSGKKIMDGKINVQRNETYQVKFFVNNEEKQVDILFDAPETSFGKLLYTCNEKLGSITIDEDAPVGGENGVYARAYGSPNILKGDHVVHLIPQISGKDFIEAPIPYNNEDLGFTLTVPKYVKGIKYVIEYNGEKSTPQDAIVLEDKDENDIYENDTNVITASILKTVKVFLNDELERTGRLTLKDITIEIVHVTYLNALKNDEDIDITGVPIAKVNNLFGGGAVSTLSQPYKIGSSRHFCNIKYYNASDFIVTNYFVVDASNAIENFYGTFDGDFLGDGSPIGLTGKRYKEVGLFINNYGTIKDVQLHTDAESSSYGVNLIPKIGGIVCYNRSGASIIDSSVIIDVEILSFMANLGGIACENYGVIDECWTSSNVITYGDYGAIACTNKGTISNSITSGTITQKVETYEGCYENNYVGGIVAINYGTVMKCRVGGDTDSLLTIIIDVPKVNDKILAPYTGPIYALNKGKVSGCFKLGGYDIITGNLHSFWEWFATYDQLRNINENYS